VLKPTERGFLPVPWLDLAHRASADLDVPRGWPPYDGDPRQALARVIDRYTALG
jgi:glutamine synthetase